MSDQRHVFTIGHSNHSIEAFVSLLRRHGVTAVADVRSIPYSRSQPQFNRDNLVKDLKDRGITYVFLGDSLGARTEDKSCYEHGRVQYQRLAKTEAFRRGLERIRADAQKHLIALMCAEREPLECHRTLLISQELASVGVAVMHIHADGHLESHAESMRRLITLLGLPEVDLFRSEQALIQEACAKQEQRVAYRPHEPLVQQTGKTGK